MAGLLLARPSSSRAEEVAGGAGDFFERKIRPLLADKCYSCHGEEKQKGRLRLDSLGSILAGGDSGPALVPGHPEQSLLVKAVGYKDPDLQMPPKKQLGEQQLADLALWVKTGAIWPGGEKPKSARSSRPPFAITEKDKTYWAFKPVQSPPPPPVDLPGWDRNPVDSFILAEMRKKGIAPNPPASRRELIRRAYFDLVGLPPSPEAVRDFEQDPAPDAYEKLVDRLLSLPQYGERWGRHWLDVVRFAQTNGYERDGEKPLAWRYRDYVIRAFNQDKPYDRFLTEQLAGDEMENATNDSLIATGFYRVGVWDDEPDDKRMAEFDELDDVVVSTSAAFMGLTMGCARCHDHMFDPISNTDYYQYLAFFRNIKTMEAPKYAADSGNYAALSDPERDQKWKAEQEARIRDLEVRLAACREAQEKPKLEEQLKKLREEKPPAEWALVVRERGPKPPPTHVLARGNAATPGAEVEPAFLTVLGGRRPELRDPAHDSASTGRRLALARWLASPENPLTARVMVNRVWKYHFGQGIVKTTTDFGKAGIPPTHPELLDWLAAEFMRSGWSVKKLHKTIMLSQTYRLSSQARNEPALAADAANTLLWRQNLRRLEAETVRDTILEVSGQLNPAMEGRGFFPQLAGEVLAGASNPGLGWELSPEPERARRTVYTFVKRTMLSPVLENFDYNNTSSPLGERPTTTVAPQALMLLNDSFMHGQAAALAARLVAEAGRDPAAQVARAYQLALGRDPKPAESFLALDYLRRQRAAFSQIQSRLSFRPEVPFSLNEGFLGKLTPTDMFVGPTEGWTCHRGVWSAGYGGIKTVEKARSPFALYDGRRFGDGEIAAKVMLHRSAEFGSILFRAEATNGVQTGYDLVLDVRRQKTVLRRHAKEVATLAEADTGIAVGVPKPVKIGLLGKRIQVWLDNAAAPIFDIADPEWSGRDGFVGVRAWGAAMSLDDLVLDSGGRNTAVVDLRPSESDRRLGVGEQRALEAFSLLVLNLNELIYVD